MLPWRVVGAPALSYRAIAPLPATQRVAPQLRTTPLLRISPHIVNAHAVMSATFYTLFRTSRAPVATARRFFTTSHILKAEQKTVVAPAAPAVPKRKPVGAFRGGYVEYSLFFIFTIMTDGEGEGAENIVQWLMHAGVMQALWIPVGHDTYRRRGIFLRV